jgi:queuosine precursor transporter
MPSAKLATRFCWPHCWPVASITAFVLSELADWAIYSFWKKPLQQRILVSSLVAVPLDTFAFQHLAGYLTPAAFTTEVISKAIGVLIVWYLLKMRSGNTGEPVAA